MIVKSNKFLLFSAFMLLTSCAQQDLAVRNYKSTVPGYEERVAEIESREEAQNNARTQTASAPPVTINNPLAYTQQGPYGTMPPGSVQPVFVQQGGNAYGSLNGTIQSGAIMQNSTPVYQQPSSFGSIYYPPAR